MSGQTPLRKAPAPRPPQRPETSAQPRPTAAIDCGRKRSARARRPEALGLLEQREGGGGEQAADEAAAGLVVAAQEDEDRRAQDQRHQEPRRGREDQRVHRDAFRPALQRRDRRDAGDDDHRDLAQRVEAAEVDQDHVDDVVAERRRARSRLEEAR